MYGWDTEVAGLCSTWILNKELSSVSHAKRSKLKLYFHQVLELLSEMCELVLTFPWLSFSVMNCFVVGKGKIKSFQPLAAGGKQIFFTMISKTNILLQINVVSSHKHSELSQFW